MDDTTTLLEQLRDVRSPLPPEGVSLWLIAANVGAVCLIVVLIWYRRTQNTDAWRRQLIKNLRKARQQPPHKAINTAATLLRQLMLFRGLKVQTLSGESWLRELDKHFQTQWYTQKEGQVFGDTLYRPGVADKQDAELILEELETLIKSLPALPGKEADSS